MRIYYYVIFRKNRYLRKILSNRINGDTRLRCEDEKIRVIFRMIKDLSDIELWKKTLKTHYNKIEVIIKTLEKIESNEEISRIIKLLKIIKEPKTEQGFLDAVEELQKFINACQKVVIVALLNSSEDISQLNVLERIFKDQLNIEIIYEDTKGDPEITNNIIKRNINKGLKLFLGPYTSHELSQIKIIEDCINENEVVIISPFSSSEVIKDYNWLYRLVPSDRHQINYLIKLMVNLKGNVDNTRIAIVYRNDDYANGLVKFLEEQLIYTFSKEDDPNRQLYRYDNIDEIQPLVDKLIIQNQVVYNKHQNDQDGYQVVFLFSFEEGQIYADALRDAKEYSKSNLIEVQHLTSDGFTYRVRLNHKFALSSNIRGTSVIGESSPFTNTREKFINAFNDSATENENIAPKMFFVYDILLIFSKFPSLLMINENIDNFYATTGPFTFDFLNDAAGPRKSLRECGEYVIAGYDIYYENELNVKYRPWLQCALAGCNRLLRVNNKEYESSYYNEFNNTYLLKISNYDINNPPYLLDFYGRKFMINDVSSSRTSFTVPVGISFDLVTGDKIKMRTINCRSVVPIYITSASEPSILSSISARKGESLIYQTFNTKATCFVNAGFFPGGPHD
jgi:hypothetical protein